MTADECLAALAQEQQGRVVLETRVPFCLGAIINCAWGSGGTALQPLRIVGEATMADFKRQCQISRKVRGIDDHNFYPQPGAVYQWAEAAD